MGPSVGQSELFSLSDPLNTAMSRPFFSASFREVAFRRSNGTALRIDSCPRVLGFLEAPLIRARDADFRASSGQMAVPIRSQQKSRLSLAKTLTDSEINNIAAAVSSALCYNS